MRATSTKPKLQTLSPLLLFAMSSSSPTTDFLTSVFESSQQLAYGIFREQPPPSPLPLFFPLLAPHESGKPMYVEGAFVINNDSNLSFLRASPLCSSPLGSLFFWPTSPAGYCLTQIDALKELQTELIKFWSQQVNHQQQQQSFLRQLALGVFRVEPPRPQAPFFWTQMGVQTPKYEVAEVRQGWFQNNSEAVRSQYAFIGCRWGFFHATSPPGYTLVEDQGLKALQSQLTQFRLQRQASQQQSQSPSQTPQQFATPNTTTVQTSQQSPPPPQSQMQLASTPFITTTTAQSDRWERNLKQRTIATTIESQQTPPTTTITTATAMATTARLHPKKPRVKRMKKRVERRRNKHHVLPEAMK